MVRAKSAEVVAYDPMGLILAVDPATTCGWAAFREGRLLESGFLKGVPRPGGGNEVDVVGAYRVFRRFAGGVDQGVLVVEEQFGHSQAKRKVTKQNPVTGEDETVTEMVETGLIGYTRTVESRMVWEAFAAIFGWKRIRVFPATWQSQAGFGRLPRVERKRMSIAMAQTVKPGVKNDNESDSIALGLWAIRAAQPGGRHASSPLLSGGRRCSRRA